MFYFFCQDCRIPERPVLSFVSLIWWQRWGWGSSRSCTNTSRRAWLRGCCTVWQVSIKICRLINDSLSQKNHNSINYLCTTTFWYTRNSCNFRFVHCVWTCNFPCEAPLWIVLLPVPVPYSKEFMWLPYSDYNVGGSRGMGGRGHLFSSQFLVVISDTCSQSHQSKNNDLIIVLFLCHVIFL